MRSRLHLAIALGFFKLLSVGCAHEQRARAQQGDANEQEEENFKVPLELWSPAKKKANASYYFMVGEFELLNRNIASAAKFLETSYNLDPNPYVAAKMIEAKAILDVDAALSLAKKNVLLYPQSSEIQLLYGRLLIAKGELKQAELAIQQAIKLNPHDIDAYIFIVQIYEAQNRYKEAISYSREMLKRNGDFAEGWVQLTKLLIANKQNPQALEAAEKAFNLGSGEPAKIHLYATLQNINGQRKKAAKLYQNLINMRVHQEEEIGEMVDLFRQLGSFDDAVKELKKAEAVAGADRHGVVLQQAFVYWEMKKFKEASAIFDELAAAYPQADRFSYMAALGNERLNQLDKALEIYWAFDDSSEFYVPARLRAINILKEKNEIEKALSIAQDAINGKGTHFVEFYSVAAGLLGLRQRHEEAIRLLQEGYEGRPDRVDLLFLIAVNQEKVGKIEECIATLKDVLAKDPLHSAAHNYIGYLFAERGINLDQAEEHIKKALEIKPDDGYYLDSMGWVYFQKGDYKKALDYLLKANDKIADEATILEHLGDTCLALDRVAEAVSWFEKASKVKMEEKDLERVKKKYENSKAKLSS